MRDDTGQELGCKKNSRGHERDQTRQRNTGVVRIIQDEIRVCERITQGKDGPALNGGEVLQEKRKLQLRFGHGHVVVRHRARVHRATGS